MRMESDGGIILAGETDELEEKPVSVPLYPPQTTNRLTRVQTGAAVERCQRLTA